MNISRTEKEKLYEGLGLFIESFRPYITSILIKRFGNDWNREFVRTLYSEQRESWERKLSEGKKPEEIIDFKHLKSFAIDRENQNLLKEDFKYETGSLATWCGEIYDARNGVAHFDSTLEEDKAVKAWINLRTIARIIGNNELERQLYNLQKNDSTQVAKRIEGVKSTFTQHSTETLDIVNCAKSWQEVFAEEVYLCLTNSSFNHLQCKYFGVYFLKRVGAIGEIEAVIDVYENNRNEVYFINGNQNVEEYFSRARKKIMELRPNQFPHRVFLLKDLYTTEFIKDSENAMRENKTYLNIEDLKIKDAKELAEILNGRRWSEFGK